MKKFLKFWLPAILWAAFIFCLSAIPHLKSGFACDFILRKMAHVTEYFVLAFFLYRAIKNFFMTSVLYAVSDEIHQLFVPGRHGSPNDVLIDMIGIVCFYLMIKLIQYRMAARDLRA